MEMTDISAYNCFIEFLFRKIAFRRSSLITYLLLDNRRIVIFFFPPIPFQSVSCVKMNPEPNTGFSGHTHTRVVDVR